jgi:hypothetical protein
VQALRDEDQPIRDAAAATLAGLGPPAKSALLAALQNRDLYIREWAIQALAKSKPLPDDVVRALKTAASNDRSRFVRYEAAAVLVQAGVTTGRRTPEPFQPEDAISESSPDDGQRLYSRDEIFANIPPDDDHEYPMRRFYLLSFNRSPDRYLQAEFLAAIYRGEDRPDRLIFWKMVDNDKYRRLQVIGAQTDMNESFYPPVVFFPEGQVPGEGVQFLDVPTDRWRGHGDYLFAIDGEQLRPVEVESPEQWYRDKLRPGEEIIRSEENSFSNHALDFRFYVEAGRKTEQVVGRYKVVKEVGRANSAGSGVPFGGFFPKGIRTASGMSTTTWKLMVDYAKVQPIQSR